eukprot:2022472-Pyramimonas_sp.AAC.1
MRSTFGAPAWARRRLSKARRKSDWTSRSCTSSTTTCDTPASPPSPPAIARSSTPVVQKRIRVRSLIRRSMRTAYPTVCPTCSRTGGQRKRAKPSVGARRESVVSEARGY